MTRPALLRPGFLRLAALGVCALALSGCISLLPKSKPAQLYRFGQAPVAAAAPAPAQRVGVFRAIGLFQREAAGDRLLTVTGSRTAYIADVRWVAPAQVLFDEAVLRAFDSAAGPARLVSRGEPVKTAYALRLDVRNFETRYDVPDGRPTVVVRIRATLTRDQDRAIVGERMFEAQVPASENRVAAIVEAYDAALGKTLGELTAWVNSQVRAA